MSEYKNNKAVPIWQKMALTIDEAAAYSNIGINRIRELCDDPDCSFVLFVGRKKLIKRKAFEEYINRRYEI